MKKSKASKKVKKSLEYVITAEQVYDLVEEKVDALLFDIDELYSTEDLQMTLDLEMLEEFTGHAYYESDEPKESIRVLYPNDETVITYFKEQGAKGNRMRILELDHEEDYYAVRVRIGGYKVVYTTPQLEEV